MGPLRTCVGCRSTDLRSALLRVVVGSGVAGDLALVVDVGRCMPGRGAWLHPEPRCLELAERRRAFPRALRHAGSLESAAVRAHLERMRGERAAGSVPGDVETSKVDMGSGFDKPMAAR